jgi:hypothetical protein
MWWETAGEQVVKDIIATSSSVREGVERLLAYFEQRHPHPVWKRMAALDYEGDAGAIQAWFVGQLPFPEAVEVLWFAFWDETEGFDLRGSTTWSKDPENWDWWYSDDFRGQSYESAVLVQMHALAREVEDPTVFPHPKGGVWDLMEYLLTIGYIGLVGAQVFRNTDRRQLLGGRDERWCVTGFPDAVYGIIVGRVTNDGFVPFNQTGGPQH